MDEACRKTWRIKPARKVRARALVGFGLGVATLAIGASFQQSVKPTPAQASFFETKIRPILANNCYGCHGPTAQLSGLRLDSIAAILKGGASGPAVVPGNPEKSPLIQAV